MITFVEYFQETLKFLVIVLRTLKPSTPPLISLAESLPPVVQFSLDSIFCTGLLRKKYPKEAAIFTLEVDSTLFYHNHHAINLRSARLYIVKAIENMLGPFRDYNGGLLYKESEQLLGIKRALEEKGITCPDLEDLFYSIKPITLRALLTVETGIELVQLFLKIRNQPLEGEKYLLVSARFSESHLALIKTCEKTWKSSLIGQLLAASPQIGCAAIEREGFFYFCFFHQYPQANILFDILHSQLKHLSLSSHRRKNILNINFQGGDPPSLNPRLAADINCHILSNLLFEGLMRIDRWGKVEPAAAEKITISSCSTLYTFHIRNTCWSNGEEVTAYHFEKAWKKAIMGNIPAYPYPDFFYSIFNAKKAREKILPLDQVGIVAKDTKTLIITLESPCPYFLNLLTTPPFFPLLGDAEEPTEFNGPFTLSDWKRNTSLLLTQNPFYRNESRSKLSAIQIFMIKNPHTAYELFQKGELDLLGDPTSPLPPEILKRPELQASLFHKPVSRIFWIHCNRRAWPLQNTSLRKALNLAINRKRLTDHVFVQQTPHCSPLPLKYSQISGCVEGEPSLARFYFKKALHELNLEQKQFPSLVLSHSELSFEKPLYKELKSQWKEVLGITVLSKQLPWDEFSGNLEKGNFQLGGLFRRDPFNHVLFYLSFFKNIPNNPHSLDSEQYTQLFDKFYLEQTQESSQEYRNTFN